MRLYSIWIDGAANNIMNGSYQDWSMYQTCEGYTVFARYLKIQHTLGII